MVLLPLQEHPPDLPGSRVHLLATDVELELCKKKHKLMWTWICDLWIMQCMGGQSLFKRVEGASIPTAYVYIWHVHAGQFSQRYRRYSMTTATRLSSEISCIGVQGFQVWSVLRSSSTSCVSASLRKLGATWPSLCCWDVRHLDIFSADIGMTCCQRQVHL
jgi:hypothetical protein